MRIIKKPASVVNVVGRNVVVGTRRSTTIKDPLDYLKDITDLDLLSDDSIYDIITVCRKLYKGDFLCGPAIDAYNNFATTPLRVEPTGNEKFDDIVQLFFDNLNYGTGYEPGIYHFMQRFGLGFLVDGNVIPLKTYSRVETDSGEIVLPLRISLLNPLNIYIDKTASEFGPKKIYYRVDDDFLKILKKDGRKDVVKKTIPSLIKRRYKTSLKNFTKDKFHSHIPLNPELVDHLKRKAMDYEDWGTPFLTRTFRAVTALNKLIKLDESTMDGLLNLITIFKIGTDEYPADQPRIDAFANLISNNNQGTETNRTMVWSHDVTVEQVGPGGKVMEYDKRMAEGVKNLRTALGLPSIIADGSASGDVWASMLPMLESLMALRNSQTIWLQDTLMQIAEQNDIILDQKPSIIWDRMNLVDDKSIKELIISFYDRGLLDPDTAITESGRDFAGILQRKKDLKKSGDDLLFMPPKLPYSADNSTDPNGNSPDNGRPKKKEVKKEMETTASLFNKDIFQSLSKDLNEKIVQQSDSQFETYLIGEMFQLNNVVQNINELDKHWGIATDCRKAIEECRDTILSNPYIINESIEKLYDTIVHIRQRGK